MPKWLASLLLIFIFFFSGRASAQGEEIRLAAVDLKLWPEYDQPGMLVIYDIQPAEGITLPTPITLHIPVDAEINAVAALVNEEFVDRPFDGPILDGEWQLITISIQEATIYRIEYYQALSIAGSTRQFSFLWFGDYAVDSFNISVQQPVDTTSMTTDPAYEPTQESDNLTYYNSPPFSLRAGEKFTLNVTYEKSSDRLTVPSSNIQPSEPINEGTSGRVSLGNYVPYIVGALGVIFVVGGLGYYYLWGRPRATPGHRRRRSHSTDAEGVSGDVYCHQCGQRARPGDRFCRVCGTRLRQQNDS